MCFSQFHHSLEDKMHLLGRGEPVCQEGQWLQRTCTGANSSVKRETVVELEKLKDKNGSFPNKTSQLCTWWIFNWWFSFWYLNWVGPVKNPPCILLAALSTVMSSLFHQAQELQHQREESNQQGWLLQVRSHNFGESWWRRYGDEQSWTNVNSGQRVGRASAAPTYQAWTPPLFQTQGQTLAMAQETKSKCSLFLLGKGA